LTTVAFSQLEINHVIQELNLEPYGFRILHGHVPSTLQNWEKSDFSVMNKKFCFVTVIPLLCTSAVFEMLLYGCVHFAKIRKSST
jgi:hypothetical protein